MDQAREAAAARHWIEPTQQSVLAYAERILAVDPSHAGARQLLADTVAGTTEAGVKALNGEALAEAKRLGAEAQTLATKHKVASGGVDRLMDAIAAEERKQREAAERAAQTASREAEIGRLIDRAGKALAANRLTTPSGDNAVRYARDLLRIKPQHPEAQRTLTTVVERYIAMSHAALAKGQTAAARSNQGKASALAGVELQDDAALRSLDERIASEEKRQEDLARERREAERLAKVEAEANAPAATKAAKVKQAAKLDRKSEADRFLEKAQGAFPEIIVGSEQANEDVQVRDVRVEDGVVSGVVINNTGNELRDVKLLIRYKWVWKNETSPGHDSPGRAIPYSVQEKVPPGGQARFAYHPEPPLPQRPDGRFLNSVVVLGYTQFR